ncbi:protein kintoun-like [Cimex lectularius]|uniref:PIH1 N-terminal domain-containing protein n=1 Tax=Cimex lectularius TaxID=79782 RepID=A0A8I6SVB5_CIMLE|nr:protein kintoun-like [Cimex lectularius]
MDRSSEILDDSISKLLNKRPENKDDDIPCKMVKPSPGFCVKTHTLEGDKVFMNICYTDDIPEPEDLTDAELITILESEEPATFKVPMSLGSLHTEVDKSGNLCSAYDIAINSRFFNKIVTNQLFQTFFLTVVMEGLMDKYSLELTLREPKPYHIIKNRKCLGTLQMHRIQQRPVRKNVPLIQELPYVSPYTKVETKPNLNENKEQPKSMDCNPTVTRKYGVKKTDSKLLLNDELDESLDIRLTPQPKAKPLIEELPELSKQKSIKKKPLIEEISDDEYNKIKQQSKKQCEVIETDVKNSSKEVKSDNFPVNEISHLDINECDELKDNKFDTSKENLLAVDDNNKVRLFGVPNNERPEKIVAFIKFKALSGQDISLDVSEKRVVACGKKSPDLVDFNLPVRITPEKVTANYCVNLQVLKLILPIMQLQESVMAID